uniref:Ribosomal protein L6 n=1 Tax=Pseudo-nitzschia cuspidata TaxID=237455 RepID=A0A888T965_9STRA|nr:ribosomal protein L6 [Pseudo-nitzschia cuspidata]QRC12158.1 ribosomal protein L6 [Pseudo-nitzschia cuspidata]
MKNSKKKYSVKVPKNIKILYCDKKNLITFIGPLATKSLNLKIKLLLIPSDNLIIATSLPVDSKSIMGLKSGKKIQGTTIAKIKQILTEVTYVLSRKLNLVGVGYRAFSYDKLPNQMYFKLGYSHLIYFRIPEGLTSSCLKFTKIFIQGNKSYDLLTQTAAQIRNCKLPEPYKGKGILHDQETIILKKGKKI